MKLSKKQLEVLDHVALRGWRKTSAVPWNTVDALIAKGLLEERRLVQFSEAHYALVLTTKGKEWACARHGGYAHHWLEDATDELGIGDRSQRRHR